MGQKDSQVTTGWVPIPPGTLLGRVTLGGEQPSLCLSLPRKNRESGTAASEESARRSTRRTWSGSATGTPRGLWRASWLPRAAGPGAGRGPRGPLRPAGPGQAPARSAGAPPPASPTPGRGRQARRPALRKAAGPARRSGPFRPRRAVGGAPSVTAATRRAPWDPHALPPRGPASSPGRRSPGPTWTLRQAGTPAGQSRPLPPRTRLRRGSDSAMGSLLAAGTLKEAQNYKHRAVLRRRRVPAPGVREEERTAL